MYNYLAKIGFWTAILILTSAAAQAQDRYFGEFDGVWDDPFAWEGGVVPTTGENALLVRPYLGIIPALQPLLVQYHSATDPQLNRLVIESSNWLIQDANPGFDVLSSYFEIIGGYRGTLIGPVESVDNPAHRSSHVQNGGTNTVAFLTIGDIANSGGRYLLNGGALGTGFTIAGNQGLGEFEQNGGIHMTEEFILGLDSGGTGTLHFTGGELNVGENLYVGYEGTGTVVHTGSADATIEGDLILGAFDSGWGEYNFDSSVALNVLGDLQVRRGTFRHLGGTIETGGALDVGAGGQYTMSGGASQNVTGDLNVLGSFELQNGSLDVGRDAYVSAGSFDHTFGTHHVDGVLRVGNVEGELANYYLRRGVLSVDSDEYIGSRGGFGVFRQEGGIHDVNGALVLGYEANFDPFPVVVDETGAIFYTMTGGELNCTAAPWRQRERGD